MKFTTAFLRQYALSAPIAFVSALLSWQAGGTEVTQPAVDGMVLQLKSDALQQVKIRLKSFGPGFCQVTIDLAGKTNSYAAPPLTWSTWLPIGPGLSGGAHKLGFSPGCDTGALGEVKYDK